jgi:predicted enzyme involved in methoxymalonyl-ACP biosynthesis
MESAMLDALVQSCRDKEISRIVGHYIASTKNGMVADHYQTLGFSPGRQDDQACSTWLMSLDDYVPKTRHIRICQPVSLG